MPLLERTQPSRLPLPTIDLLRRFVGFFDAILAWQERAAQRHHLAGLDDRMLADMGLNRADVQREIGKPFWMP